MILSAVSVLVVAQSGSEAPEGLMNYLVQCVGIIQSLLGTLSVNNCKNAPSSWATSVFPSLYQIACIN